MTSPCESTAKAAAWPSMKNPHTDMVTIQVNTKTFLIHSEFICHASPFFKKAFSSDFVEAQSREMDCNDTTPDAFGIFVQYAYTKSLVNIEPSLSLLNLVDTWLLADKLLIPELQDLLLNKIRTTTMTPARLSNLPYDRIWKNTMDGSELRKVLVTEIASKMAKLPDTLMPKEMLIEIFGAMRTLHPVPASPTPSTIVLGAATNLGVFQPFADPLTRSSLSSTPTKRKALDPPRTTYRY